MKGHTTIAILAAFSLFLAAGCAGQEKKVTPSTPGTVSPITKASTPKKHTLPKEPLLTTKAIVQALDAGRRVVTLRDLKGQVFDVKAGEEVENLTQITIGDTVMARYYEWSAVEIEKRDKPEGSGEKQAETTDSPGTGTVGEGRDSITVMATVVAINHPRTHVTIRDRDGRSTKVFVRTPRFLNDVKEGDTLLITYTEALAIFMEKAK